jgi:hypothetical protein
MKALKYIFILFIFILFILLFLIRPMYLYSMNRNKIKLYAKIESFLSTHKGFYFYYKYNYNNLTYKGRLTLPYNDKEFDRELNRVYVFEKDTFYTMFSVGDTICVYINSKKPENCIPCKELNEYFSK